MHIHLNTKIKLLSFFVIGGIIIYTALANSTGSVNGRTSTTSPGCNCHDPVSNSATTVSVVSSTGSFNVAPGSTTNFTITVTNATEVKAGIDIAVKTTQTGETDIGTLTPNVSTGLKPNGKELVHYQPKPLVSGSASFQFSWKAPNTPGTYYLRAVGNAVNGDGDTTGYLDHWNWMPVQPITVGTPPSGLTLSSPAGGEQWCRNSSQNITWTSSGIANVKIELSTDGGSTFPAVLTVSTAGSAQSWKWDIPANQTLSNTNKIRISDASNPGTSSITPGNFTISDITSINTQPQSLTKCTGQSAVFSVIASGSGLNYQWKKNGNNIQNANSADYNIQSVSTNDSGAYECIVTGTCGSPITSSQVTLTVNISPSITQNPVSQSIQEGGNIDFTVIADGTNISYQWQKNGTDINGANTNDYHINALKLSDSGDYACKITNICNSVTSNSAHLTVTPKLSGPILTLQHSTIDFGKVVINTQKDTIFTNLITNTGDQQLSITGLNFTPSTNDFTIINPPALPLLIDVNASTSLQIRFQPTTLGTKNISLNFTGNSTSNPVLNLTGIGINPVDVNETYNLISYFKAFPNPGNNNINIEYSLENSSSVEMFIYDIRGVLIKYLGRFNARGGLNSIQWNGLDDYNNNIPSGTYNILIKANSNFYSYQIILLK
ncbi:MAG: choice-of-anchor V domain-containing protein [FCB group bacterium]|jgi:hypothetical protein